MAQLRQNPQVVIGTPGRIIDHLERGSLSLKEITTLVLDEADRMLDLGFAPQIRRILDVVPKNRQTLLFSATMPPDIVRIAQTYMQLPLRVEVAPAGTTAERVSQELFIVPKEQKVALLSTVLREYLGTVLVFTRTKHGAKKLARAVQAMGHAAVEIHGNRSLSQRKEALGGFKAGRYRVLVATDIAARGIDVTGIELVVNYDIPEQAEDYVHRIGRTGRAGQTGHAITFVEPQQRQKVRAIERLVRMTLAIKSTPALGQTPSLSLPREAQQPAPTDHVHPSWGRRPRHQFRRR
jgi:ATP-dependent RNA helicase RhlE